MFSRWVDEHLEICNLFEVTVSQMVKLAFSLTIDTESIAVMFFAFQLK